MRVRHRIPSIFNLSMVDVLCCALGCVILIWLINLKVSKQHEVAAQHDADEANALLAMQKSKIADLENQRAAVQAQAAAIGDLESRLKDAQARVASLQGDVTARDKDLITVRAGADDLARKLTD